MNGEEYQPNTLYYTINFVASCASYARLNSKAGIDFFLKDAEFAGLQGVMDGEMKQLQAKGLGSHKLNH